VKREEKFEIGKVRHQFGKKKKKTKKKGAKGGQKKKEGGRSPLKLQGFRLDLKVGRKSVEVGGVSGSSVKSKRSGRWTFFSSKTTWYLPAALRILGGREEQTEKDTGRVHSLI